MDHFCKGIFNYKQYMALVIQKQFWLEPNETLKNEGAFLPAPWFFFKNIFYELI